MGISLSAYIDELHGRSDLIWPKPADAKPMKATPYLKPLPEVKLVTWSLYGTLLEIDHGKLLHHHPQEIRMQIALEKVIKEFNMWNSMTRRQGQPWEGMLILYDRFREDLEMVSSKHKGDFTETDSVKIWSKILDRLKQKDYTWDAGKYGDQEEFALKIAYFFHASLQGVQAAPDAQPILAELTKEGVFQGLLADAQAFSLAQLKHELSLQGRFSSVAEMFSPEFFFLSYQEKLRKPSLTLYKRPKEVFKKHGILPEQVLHVSHRLKDDLAIAKKSGFRTALLVADQTCQVTAEEVRHPDMKPDRLLTEVRQIRQIVGR
ncbi:HAD family hydrolase [Thalassoglobus sp. JC818]|uniref:HAD family hydrolase n=1 Tax=Thalassoglobus sp. JC818 TaxID=3232136 RepID=UPI00345A1D51